MKKLITILLLSFLMLSCGARKRNLDKGSNQEKIENQSEGNSKTDLESNTTKVQDVYKFLSEIGLNIQSNGEAYKLEFGGLKFEGKANMQFNQKSDETRQKLTEKTKTTYRTETNYKSDTTYKTHTTYKTLETEREGVSFGDILLIIGVSFIVGIIATLAVQSRLKFIS